MGCDQHGKLHMTSLRCRQADVPGLFAGRCGDVGKGAAALCVSAIAVRVCVCACACGAF